MRDTLPPLSLPVFQRDLLVSDVFSFFMDLVFQGEVEAEVLHALSVEHLGKEEDSCSNAGDILKLQHTLPHIVI